MLAERTLAFAAQAPGIQNRKALGASLMNLVETLGATRYACLYLRREAGEVAIERSISNLPRTWQQAYLERGYDATDPIFNAVVRGGAYGYWSELTRGVTIDKAGREVMVGGKELVRSEKARAALRVACDIFANEGARMLKIAEDEENGDNGQRELSRTQLKVLLMRADGLSNKQVAQQLGRHEKTVECHVTEILRRLEARNMIDAIRIATKLKLII